MNNQNSKCCEKCTGERNPTMMCQSIFCPCHTTSKSEAQILDEVSELPKDFWDKQKVDAFNSITLPRTRLENWEEKSLFETRLAIFIDFVEKEANRIDEERRGAHRKDGGRKMQSILFLKSFISTLLQEERGKTFEEGLRWGRASLKAELVEGLEAKKKIYDGGSGEKELLFIDPTAVEGYNVGIDEAIELVKKI